MYHTTHAGAMKLADSPYFPAPIAHLRDRLNKPFTGHTFLDAGCAEDIICPLMRLLGAKVYGVEPNPRACRLSNLTMEHAPIRKIHAETGKTNGA